MSTLTIFEKDGIRRFVKLENSDIMNCTRYPKIRKGEVLKEIEAETQPKAEMTALTKVDVNTMSEQEKLEFVKQLLPEGIVLTDTRMAQLEQEKKRIVHQIRKVPQSRPTTKLTEQARQQ